MSQPAIITDVEPLVEMTRVRLYGLAAVQADLMAFVADELNAWVWTPRAPIALPADVPDLNEWRQRRAIQAGRHVG